MVTIVVLEVEITLQFLPGNHTLDMNLDVANIQQLEILGNSNAPTQVMCGFAVGFSFANISKVRIDGLVFVSCAHPFNDYHFGLYFELVQTTEVSNCTFQDSYGTALGVVHSNLVLKNVNWFLSNCRKCLRKGCDPDGYHSCLGGGIYAGLTNLTLSGNCTFKNNTALEGGGVYAEYKTQVRFSGNTIFQGNSARYGGGVTSLYSNLSFIGNTTFYGNLALRYGGGVHSEENSTVKTSGSTTFIGNSANNGGGIYTWLSDVNISGNATFSDNSAFNRGGGVYAYGQNILSIGFNGNITFSSNVAENDGGGIYVLQYGSSVNIGGIIYFNSNSAGEYGGGICAEGNGVHFSGNATFSDNSAMYGGGISVERFLALDGNSNFTGCSASADGGAIYVHYNIYVNFSGTNIISTNKAARFGGGIYAPISILNLSGHNAFSSNSAEKGGGIYAPESWLDFSGSCTLHGNNAHLDGGGLYTDGTNLNFSGNIIITSNTAVLGGGIYSDNSTLNINGYNIIEMNAARYYGGGLYIRRTALILAGNSLIVANSAGEGGGIYATASSTLDFDGMNIFEANRGHISGGGIWLDSSSLTLNGCNSFERCVANYEGGGIFTYAATVSLPGNNTFLSNSATTGGGIHSRWSSVVITNISHFEHNAAVFGGMIFTDNSTFEFNGSSTFRDNQANHTGGGIYAARSVFNFAGRSSITANHAARDGGGIYARDGCVVNLLGVNNYEGNSAEDTGGGISLFNSSFSFSGQNTFNNNRAVTGGGFYSFNSAVKLPGDSKFISNSAAIYGGGFATIRSMLHLNGSTILKNNSAPSGGAIYIENSTVDAVGSNCFMYNTAMFEGGAIHATNSIVYLIGKDMFVANSAGSKGGSIFAMHSIMKFGGSSFIRNSVSTLGAAIHVSSTILIFQGSSSFMNNSAQCGGGIHTESSNITFVTTEYNPHTNMEEKCKFCPVDMSDTCNTYSISFFKNTAVQGGALYFDQYSNLSLNPIATVHFQHNYANKFGGAIYVVDVPFRNKCFFHVIPDDQSADLQTTSLLFRNNSAGIRGSVLYGGLLNKCNFTFRGYQNAMNLFNMSILQLLGNHSDYYISSDPTKLCFCSTDEQNCTQVIHTTVVFPGQQIIVSVVAVDQSNVAIPTLIHTDILSGNNHDLNVSETISYETGKICTSKQFSIKPFSPLTQLMLHPSNMSGETKQLTVNITFESCPVGFELSNFTHECICDHRLWHLTNTCNIDTQAMQRTGGALRTFWVGVENNETLIHHRYCPLDYCIRDSKYINLSNPDEQCNFKHSGLLCGKCEEGLSRVLGSSYCKKCSNEYLTLLIPFALAGILLVIFLLLLHLTVAAGTLHGLIFYSNIVAANYHIFFLQTPNNPAAIFISWLNLDLGIETCFYDGMDAYAVTWLQFVFPVYIWGIVGFLVYISDRSTTVTKLLGSSPVPVLATLFLLSYAKLLRTIITAFSLTVLHSSTPYSTTDRVVWVQDANVPSWKYCLLMVAALLFLLFLFLPYTLFLFLGQWLQSKSHLRLLYCLRNPNLKAILDSYHAPYKLRYRYWTGLMLLLRCGLFLVFSFNITGNVSINLLAICSTAFGIFVTFEVFGKVYKSQWLNILEVSFILNLGVLAVATYHVNQSGGNQDAVTYTSVGIAFLTFIGIITYQIYMRINSKVQHIQWSHKLHHRRKQCHDNNFSEGSQDCQDRPLVAPTQTVVEFHELRSPLELLDTN